MNKDIEIKMLGRFAILVDRTDIASELSKSKKGLALLQYLILQEGAAVPNQQLYEVLWPSESSSNPESALKTLISRMRAVLGKYSEKLSKCIVTERGSYRFDTSLNLNVDLYEFKRLQHQLAQKRSMEEEDLPLYDCALRIYTGDLLYDGNGQESWASSDHIELHGNYLKLVYRYLDELERLEREQREYDVDVLLLYREGDSLSEIAAARRAILEKGESVLVQRSVPANIRYKRLCEVSK